MLFKNEVYLPGICESRNFEIFSKYLSISKKYQSDKRYLATSTIILTTEMRPAFQPRKALSIEPCGTIAQRNRLQPWSTRQYPDMTKQRCTKSVMKIRINMSHIGYSAMPCNLPLQCGYYIYHSNHYPPGWWLNHRHWYRLLECHPGKM